MHIFNTSIIPTDADALWELPEGIQKSTGDKLLVIASPISKNSSEESTFLNMMKACSLSDGNYRIIELKDGSPMSWQLLSEQIAAKIILLLGVHPAQLGIHAQFVFNSANSFMNRLFIPSAPMSQIEADKDLKRSLWEDGLKPCFGK